MATGLRTSRVRREHLDPVNAPLMETTMRDTHAPGWYVLSFGACWWITMGKYVLRVGKPWGHFKYAWRPLLSFFRCYK